MRPDPTGVKKVLLKDLDDPMVGIVSFVKDPAVADARFFALKSRESGSASRRPAAGLRQQIQRLPARGDSGMLKRAVSGGR